MWKIIKKSVESVIIDKKKFSLWMKWEFSIEFASDSFWPYNYKFQREDCYFIDWLWDRWSKIFPLKNKITNNTEIFLETDDILVAVWERWGLSWIEKSFIDIINIKTEKKYRLFTNHVWLIFNSKDKVIINAEENWVYRTYILDINTLERLYEVKEELQAFFKVVYNTTLKEWYILDFVPNFPDMKDEETKFKQWSFILNKINLSWEPVEFDRETYKLRTKTWIIDIWEESIK